MPIEAAIGIIVTLIVCSIGLGWLLGGKFGRRPPIGVAGPFEPISHSAVACGRDEPGDVVSSETEKRVAAYWRRREYMKQYMRDYRNGIRRRVRVEA